MTQDASGPKLTWPQRWAAWKQAAVVYRNPRVVGMLFLGFSAGLPIALVFGTLSIWLREVGVSRTAIGFFSWVLIAYTFKFVWSPLVDRVRLPLLYRWLGQRRSWLLLSQICVVAGLFAMSRTSPQTDLWTLALLAVFVAFSSATQDIALDAFRIESVSGDLQGPMAGNYQLGYGIAFRLIAGATALYLAYYFGWRIAYMTMAGFGLVGIVATLLTSETKRAISAQVREHEESIIADPQNSRLPGWLRGALVWGYGGIVCPFIDFFMRTGWAGMVILLFIGLFRIGDLTLGVMANTFYVDLGFTSDEIANVTKLYGFVLSMAGALAGGALVYRFGAARLLGISVALTALTNLLFSWLASHSQADIWALTLTISADNFAAGIGGSVFIAYLSGLTNTAYTATQYALFSSLMSLPGNILGGFSGKIVDMLQAALNAGASWSGWVTPYVQTPDKYGGYFVFFIYTTVIAIPAFILSFVMVRIAAAQKKQASSAAPA